jgi:uncharacterized cupredoxin-like copper-binding protein
MEAGATGVRADFRALRSTLLLVGAFMAAVFIAGGVALATYSSGPAGDIPVTLSEYKVTMATTVHAGRHTFALVNDGKIAHELVVFRTDRRASKLPLRKDGDMDEESPLVKAVADSGSSLKPGEGRSVATVLSPGHYVAVCNLPTHYKLGMRIDLTVTK